MASALAVNCLSGPTSAGMTPEIPMFALKVVLYVLLFPFKLIPYGSEMYGKASLPQKLKPFETVGANPMMFLRAENSFEFSMKALIEVRG